MLLFLEITVKEKRIPKDHHIRRWEGRENVCYVGLIWMALYCKRTSLGNNEL
jgi:hypothetical protein